MRTGESIYWCKRIAKNEFAEPEEIILSMGRISVQQASGYTAVQQFGKDISSYQIMICQPYQCWVGKFKEGDKFYLDHTKPSNEEDFYGEFANYVVDKVFEQESVVRVVLKRG